VSTNCRRLAVTPGEPAGIGPDLLLAIAQQEHQDQLVAIADPELLTARAEQLGLAIELRELDSSLAPSPSKAGELWVLPTPLAAPCTAGLLAPANASYVLKTLDLAIEGCQSGLFDAVVTAPVHKGVINEAGIPFTGHTEYLQQSTNTDQVVMMLACEGLRVALVTTHLPLKDVSASITPELLGRVIEVLHADLVNQFGISAPKVIVAGLNPHAGEGGHMGREEIDVIEPLLEQYRHQGMLLEGPLPADTLFNEKYLSRCDAVLAMYHDQGLPVLKYKGFGNAVNITLGLPIVRTSVDHGTALDLAGTGTADPGSLLTAIRYAGDMARHRQSS